MTTKERPGRELVSRMSTMLAQATRERLEAREALDARHREQVLEIDRRFGEKIARAREFNVPWSAIEQATTYGRMQLNLLMRKAKTSRETP